MWTGRLHALHVKGQCMLPDGEASFLCNSALSFFYFGIVNFLDPATLHPYQMIMMRAFIQFAHGFAGFEVVSGKDPSMFKLSQDPIDRGQPYVHAVRHQDAIYILGREVANL